MSDLSGHLPLRVKLNGAALVNNWRALDRLSGAAKAGAAVKANGYGLGAVEVATRLIDAGCPHFFVAHWREAEELSAHIPATAISVLNGVLPEDRALATSLGARPVLNSTRQVKLWQSWDGGGCDVMIDTGMNRLGIAAADWSADFVAGLDLHILMSHLASADTDVTQNVAQHEAFMEMSAGVVCRARSLANSAGIALGADYHFDMTRPGLALYGGLARPELGDHITQVAQPQAQVLQVRALKPGDKLGYNALFEADRPMTAAVVAIGYADGYLRSFTNAGQCFANGKSLPVLGRVSMDLTIIDVSAAPDLQEGDWVDVDYDLARASAQSGLSPYELLTGMGQRMQRLWV